MGLSKNFAGWVRGRGTEEESDEHLAGDDPKEDRACKRGMKNTTLLKEVGI
jgi:hypothetical protein